jgi:hypothetical protein
MWLPVTPFILQPVGGSQMVFTSPSLVWIAKAINLESGAKNHFESHPYNTIAFKAFQALLIAQAACKR